MPFRALVIAGLPHHLREQINIFKTKLVNTLLNTKISQIIYIDLAAVFITYVDSSGVTVSLCSWKSWNTLEGSAK